jgi:thymidylate synthase ThyX
LRTLLLKEFITDSEETGFNAILGAQGADEVLPSDQVAAIKKAQSFYDRILDGYGDDSIGELGGAHIAIENVSMLGAKWIEDARIGGSPLEKSTRYIYFDQKVNGEYLFYREPILMTSAYRDIYVDTCNMLFETYSKLIPPLTTLLDERQPKDPHISKTAYTAALRAKVLDCLRGLLPAGTLTNMGVYGNGRFFEQLIHKMHCNNLAEMQDVGKRMFEELSKVLPSFIRRSDLSHHTHQSYANFYEATLNDLKAVAEQQEHIPCCHREPGVQLIGYDANAVARVAAALLFGQGKHSLDDLVAYCKMLPEEELARILDAGCAARETRRHKSPRALAHAPPDADPRAAAPLLRLRLLCPSRANGDRS